MCQARKPPFASDVVRLAPESHVDWAAPGCTGLAGRTMARQRRGVLGCTNLPSISHNGGARADAHHLRRQPPNSRDTRCAATQDAARLRLEETACDSDGTDRQMQLETTQRDKFKLPLISSSSTGGTATRDGQCRTKNILSTLTEHDKARQVLEASIDSHETASKSYKNEHWYSSAIGCGSRRSVLLAAFKSCDPGGSGFITSKQLIEGLQAPNFGLDERQARSLLVEFDDQLLKEGAKVPYRSFVKHLRLSEERSSQSGRDPTIFYQESYINRVRAHAAQLIEKVATEGNSTGDSSKERTSVVLAPLANNGPCRDTAFTQSNDVDRLSYEFDKLRKKQREEAKSKILLAHISRIDAFSQHQQQLVQQHEAMRLAAKALHRHAHFEQAFEEENRRLRNAQRQAKGMLSSSIAKMQHNVSRESVFYVEPV